MATESATTSLPDIWLGLGQAAKLCPSTRGGKPVHSATLCRWILKGVPLQGGGRLKLRAKKFPGGWATTRAFLDEFTDGLTADSQGEQATNPEIRLPAARRRSHEAAERELSRLGI